MTIVTIISMPQAGECRIVKKVWFPSGPKYRLIDQYGREWHKKSEELRRKQDVN